ncbi:uncharacterized protein [Epargyreus clarus]|uniref:uncharacterized protein n=1 Tax=Epargyreus clarus TaxID=520877 RepID=UPI003C2B7835
MGVLSVYILPIFAFIRIETVPPEACFANFRWDDCGQAPTPVMYYWKPGSRCEVGMWRGCLPNLNMFQDEYECVTTCIFTSRAMPEDYHSINENEIEDKTETTEAEIESTTGDTEATTELTAADSDGNGDNGGNGGNGGSGDTAGTEATDAVTTEAAEEAGGE